MSCLFQYYITTSNPAFLIFCYFLTSTTALKHFLEIIHSSLLFKWLSKPLHLYIEIYYTYVLPMQTWSFGGRTCVKKIHGTLNTIIKVSEMCSICYWNACFVSPIVVLPNYKCKNKISYHILSVIYPNAMLSYFWHKFSVLL